MYKPVFFLRFELHSLLRPLKMQIAHVFQNGDKTEEEVDKMLSTKWDINDADVKDMLLNWYKNSDVTNSSFEFAGIDAIFKSMNSSRTAAPENTEAAIRTCV